MPSGSIASILEADTLSQHSIDLDLLNTGHGAQSRKMHGDLRREILTILDRVGTEKGVRWTEVAKILNEQSSIPVEANELASVIKVSLYPDYAYDQC